MLSAHVNLKLNFLIHQYHWFWENDSKMVWNIEHQHLLWNNCYHVYLHVIDEPRVVPEHRTPRSEAAASQNTTPTINKDQTMTPNRASMRTPSAHTPATQTPAHRPATSTPANYTPDIDTPINTPAPPPTQHKRTQPFSRARYACRCSSTAVPMRCFVLDRLIRLRESMLCVKVCHSVVYCKTKYD